MDQTRRKQFRFDPAKIVSSVAGASTVGEYPREILKFYFSKMHIWQFLGKSYRKNEQIFTVKIVCV